MRAAKSSTGNRMIDGCIFFSKTHYAAMVYLFGTLAISLLINMDKMITIESQCIWLKY
jgi:hypothetical protein